MTEQQSRNFLPTADTYSQRLAEEQAEVYWQELTSLPQWHEYDRHQLDITYRLIRYVHDGQLHRGVPYWTHVVGAAWQMASPRAIDKPDMTLVVATLLHDTLEDNPARILKFFEDPFAGPHPLLRPGVLATTADLRVAAADTLATHFGSEVSGIVTSVTAPVDMYEGTDEDMRLRNRLEILGGMVVTAAGCLVKVADNFSHDMYDQLDEQTDTARAGYLNSKNVQSRRVLYERTGQPDVSRELSERGQQYIAAKLHDYLDHAA